MVIAIGFTLLHTYLPTSGGSPVLSALWDNSDQLNWDTNDDLEWDA